MSNSLPAELPSMEMFRDRLTFALERANMSKAELGRRTDSSSQNINNMTTREGLTYRGIKLFQIADVLQVPPEWLGGDDTVTRPAAILKSPASAKGGVTSSATAGLSALQVAGLEALTSLMRSGDFSDEEVIDLLGELKPRLARLKSR
jgi:transcriptional regulator with XRE-family HTH domain